jgi:hypothetical protein
MAAMAMQPCTRRPGADAQPNKDQPASQAMAGPARAPYGVDLHRVTDGDLHGSTA